MSNSIHKEFQEIVNFVDPFLDFQRLREVGLIHALHKAVYPNKQMYPIISRSHILCYQLGEEVYFISLDPKHLYFRRLPRTASVSVYNPSARTQILNAIADDIKEKYNISEEILAPLRTLVFKSKVPMSRSNTMERPTAFQVLEKAYLSALSDKRNTLDDINLIITDDGYAIGKKDKYFIKIDLKEPPFILQELNLETGQFELMSVEKFQEERLSFRYKYGSKYLGFHFTEVLNKVLNFPFDEYRKTKEETAQELRDSTNPLEILIKELMPVFQDELKKKYNLNKDLSNSILAIDHQSQNLETLENGIQSDLMAQRKNVRNILKIREALLKKHPHLTFKQRKIGNSENSYDRQVNLIQRGQLPSFATQPQQNLSSLPVFDSSALSYDGLLTAQSLFLENLFNQTTNTAIQNAHLKIKALLQPLFPDALDEADLLIPLFNVPQQGFISLHQPIVTSVLPFSPEKLCNSFYYQLRILAMYTRFCLPAREEYRGEDLLKAESAPFLCKNHVLYQKKGRFIYKISLNKKHPLFVMQDVTTKKQFVMPFTEVKRVVDEWNISRSNKKLLVRDLKPLYEEYRENPRIYKERSDNLPNIQEVYTLHTLKREWLEKISETCILSDKNRSEKENMFTPWTLLCDGSISCGNPDIFYKIELLDGIKFEEIRPGKIALLGPREMKNIICSLERNKTFGNLTSDLIPLIQDVYNKSITPIFEQLGNPDRLELAETQTGEKVILVSRDKRIQFVKANKNILALRHLFMENVKG